MPRHIDLVGQNQQKNFDYRVNRHDLHHIMVVKEFVFFLL